MAAPDQIVCAVCGAKNPANAKRCNSCGARIEEIRSEYEDDELLARQNQQDGFEWKWVFISFSIYMLLQTVILGVLPLVIDAYDPQGLPGLLISAGLWFLGGIIVGMISPGKTFFEPAVGAMIAVLPTIAYLWWIADVYELSMLAYITGGLLGVMVTLPGAFLGEKIQGNTGQT
ncbi:MAG: zinc ribbon domain-containing protein [Myxococcota bacterium]